MTRRVTHTPHAHATCASGLQCRSTVFLRWSVILFTICSIARRSERESEKARKKLEEKNSRRDPRERDVTTARFTGAIVVRREGPDLACAQRLLVLSRKALSHLSSSLLVQHIRATPRAVSLDKRERAPVRALLGGSGRRREPLLFGLRCIWEMTARSRRTSWDYGIVQLLRRPLSWAHLLPMPRTRCWKRTLVRQGC